MERKGEREGRVRRLYWRKGSSARRPMNVALGYVREVLLPRTMKGSSSVVPRREGDLDSAIVVCMGLVYGVVCRLLDSRW